LEPNLADGFSLPTLEAQPVTKYFQLKRRFVKFRAPSDEDDHESPRWQFSGEGMDWQDVLGDPCSVIVGEGGTGKTEEFKQQALALRAQGKPAFLCRLEMLAELPLRSALEIGKPEEVQAWCESDEHAYFFLDSVDEAKLVSARSFGTAIVRFAEAVKPFARRATIVISTRPHAWQAFADRDLVCRVLELVPTARTNEPDETIGENGAEEVSGEQTQTPGDKEVAAINVLQLAPLDNAQIKQFAEESGVADSQAFVDAIEHVDADVFANRPADLPGLIELWQTKRKIGQYSEVVENNIRLKLQEKNTRHLAASPMGPDRVLEGAQILAAAVTLTGRTSILYAPDGADESIKAISIDPNEVLTQWQPSEINALLSRSLFDESLYGAVRFHHRTAREYLAARWFQKLLQSGKGLREVQKIFFAKAYGSERLIVLPRMKPIVGWLAIWDDRFRNQVMRIDPKLLLSYGDASSLDVETRAAILRQFAKQYANQPHTPLSLDFREVRRLASPSLAGVINDLLSKHRRHNDLRTLLLRTIRDGKISGCAALAATFATDGAMDTYSRTVASQAVGIAGTTAQKRAVIKVLLKKEDAFDRQILAAVIETMWPDVLTDQELMRVLEETNASEPYSLDYLERELERLCERIPNVGRGVALLEATLTLLGKPPLRDGGFCRISVVYDWLMQFVWKLVEYVTAYNGLPEDSSILLRALALCEQADHLSRYTGDVHSKTIEFISQRRSLRWALFWYSAQMERERSALPVNKFWLVMRSPALGNIEEGDIDELLAAISKRPLLDDKLIALSALTILYRRSENSGELLRRIRVAIAGCDALEEALADGLTPREQSQSEKDFAKGQQRREKQQQTRKRKNDAGRQSFIKRVRADPNLIGSLDLAKNEAKLWNSTLWLFDEIRQKKSRNSRWTIADWEVLKADYGDEVAQRFRDFCIALWRVHQPELRSERRKETNSTSWVTIAGLSGLTMESRTSSGWAKKLTPEEASLATRYAVEELNELPPWILTLYRDHPSPVAHILLKEIEWEMSLAEDKPALSYVLSRLLWNAKELGDLLRPKLIEAIQKNPQANASALLASLSVVMRSCAPLSKGFKAFVAKRAQSANSEKARSVWIAVLLCLDSDAGLEALESWVKQAANSRQAEEWVSSVLNHVWGDRYERLSSEFKDFMKASALLKLIKIAHGNVRIEDDIQHDEAYSPAPRDHAQRARDHLLNLLLSIPGRPTRDAFLELSEFHAAEYPKNRMLVLAEEHAERDAAAEARSWTARQVAEFVESAERTPASQKELYDLALSRLDDLKLDLEEGDESEATVLQRVQDEIELRRSLANRLRQAARGKYTIASEEELANQDRTDIRLHNPAVEGRTPIEVKIAGQWTAAELSERLENQLIRQYMKESRFGAFLVVNRGSDKDKLSWGVSGKHRRPFSALIEWLGKEAIRLAKKHNESVQSVEIVGIDLLKRNASKIAKKAVVAKRGKKSVPNSSAKVRTQPRRRGPSAQVKLKTARS
jgi:hypothetical protein